LEGEYKVRDAEMGRGKMEVRVGDYFDDGWMDGGLEGGFDIIYDNTVSCSFFFFFYLFLWDLGKREMWYNMLMMDIVLVRS
jgi:hypothetical protein